MRVVLDLVGSVLLLWGLVVLWGVGAALVCAGLLILAATWQAPRGTPS